MEIVKKIAKWILREELNELQKTLNKQAHEKVEMNKQIASLKERLFGSRKVLLSQTMVECIVKMLPDPQIEIIDDDYHTDDFAVGRVIRLKHDGIVFVAETNASPWFVYANPKGIEI